MLDLVRQYWIAVAAKQGINQSIDLIAKAKRHRNVLERKIEKRVIPKTRGLKMSDQLVQIQIDLQLYRKEYDLAMSDLKQLMGIPPSIEFEIEDNPKLLDIVDLWDVSILEDLSLRNRPELFTQDIQQRIDVDEVRSAFLEMIPGISLFGSWNYNDNPFLLKNHWLLAGTRASWGLFDIPHHYARTKVAKKQIGLTKKNRLLLAMGAISQVNLAYWMFRDGSVQLNLTKEKAEIKDELLRISLVQQKRGKLDEADLIQVQTDSVNARVEMIRSYGEVQIALEQINNAVGIPRFFKTI